MADARGALRSISEKKIKKVTRDYSLCERGGRQMNKYFVEFEFKSKFSTRIYWFPIIINLNFFNKKENIYSNKIFID